jgi:hypothetical protein
VSGQDLFQRTAGTIFADQRGTFYVVYVTLNTVSGTANLNVSKFATRGFTNRPSLLFDTQVNGQSNTVAVSPPSIAMDHQGNLYVAYVEVRSGVGQEIYVSKSTDGGTSWLPEVRANAVNAAGTDYAPSIAVVPNGDVYVAWLQLWGRQNVTASVSTNGGNSFLNVQNITGEPVNTGTTQVSIAADSSGRVFAVYDDWDYAKSYYGLNFTWSDDGTSWAQPRTLSGPNANIYRPYIAVDGGDRLHVAWIDQLGGTYQLWYSRSEDRGAAWLAPVVISQNLATVSPSARTSIAISGGTMMVGWSGSQPGTSGLSFAISPNGGDSWYAEEYYAIPGSTSSNAQLAADENGTFYAAPTRTGVTYPGVLLEFWYGPPSMPTITDVARGDQRLTVSWTTDPEPNVVGYRLWRSIDGLTYSLVASVDGATTSYADAPLSDGTYWYAVQAVNDEGILSHASIPASGTVGPTTQELIDALNAQIASLQAQLDDANASLSSQLDAAQAQIGILQDQLNALQGSEAANNAAVQQQLNRLQANLTNLQNQLNQARSEQATQTMSYVNLGFEILVLVLLALIVIMLVRRPRPPAPMMAPMMGPMMAPMPGPPAPAPPTRPEDEL